MIDSIKKYLLGDIEMAKIAAIWIQHYLPKEEWKIINSVRNEQWVAIIHEDSISIHVRSMPGGIWEQLDKGNPHKYEATFSLDIIKGIIDEYKK